MDFVQIMCDYFMQTLELLSQFYPVDFALDILKHELVENEIDLTAYPCIVETVC